MRNSVVSYGLAGLGLSVALGCGSAMTAGGSTYREHGGSVQLVLTNATPEPMCGLYMSFNSEDDYGDNWLPKQGLATGGSIEFRVKPGTYKARWESCRQTKGIPNLAATLSRDGAFAVDQETQLYAYIADTVAPTSRAAMLGRNYKKVRFQGQSIEPIPPTSPGRLTATTSTPSKVEPPAAESTAQAPAAQPAKPASASFDGFVDPKARQSFAKTRHGKAVRPSLQRSHDLAHSTVNYRAR